jgi:hypothetical protein
MAWPLFGLMSPLRQLLHLLQISGNTGGIYLSRLVEVSKQIMLRLQTDPILRIELYARL